MDPDSALKEARRLDREGASGRAVLAYKLLLRSDPGRLEAKVDLSSLLVRLGRHEEALALGAEVLEACPCHPAALQNVAGACLGLGRFEEAQAYASALLDLEPGNASGHLALGLSLAGQGAGADDHFRRARALDPRDPGIRHYLIDQLLPRRAWAELLPLWKEVIDQEMAGPKARMEMAFLQLTYGDFQEGWDGYESRFEPPNEVFPRVETPAPLWDGSPFPGRTLLLHYEQGFGDTLMFIRYAARIRALGGRVAALVQPQLVSVLASVQGVDTWFTLADPVPRYDLHLPLLSVPRVLGTRLDSIPAEVPYIFAPSDPSPASEAVLPSPNLKVGLVWAGTRDHSLDSLRTLPLASLESLGRAPGVDWYSLQVGYEGGLPFENLRDLGPLLRDFGDTARVLAKLDLLVTVDTAVAHLAGAMGVPVWLLLPLVPDWRWLLDREDSPWYPTFRLFRQLDGHTWDGVLARVEESLNDLMNTRRGTC